MLQRIKRELGGRYTKGCRSGEGLIFRDKAEGCQSLLLSLPVLLAVRVAAVARILQKFAQNEYKECFAFICYCFGVSERDLGEFM